MKQLLSILIAFLSLAVSGQKKEKNTLLYSIKGNGVQASYLFGTTHIIPDSAFYFPTKLEKTLEKSEVLVLEVNDFANLSVMNKLMLETGSAFDIFTPAQTDSVVNWGSEQLKMSPDAFRKSFGKLKPFALMQISVQTMMHEPVKMYELELMGRARKYKLKLKGLETSEYQLSLFDNLPDSVLAEMILEPIRHPEAGEKSGRELIALYAAQDVEGLHKLIAQSEGLGGNTETLIYQRNRNWIPKMGEMMNENSCFFAVGAGHLGGEQGVIQLLKNEGYTVTPVYY